MYYEVMTKLIGLNNYIVEIETDKTTAINKARHNHARCANWETVEIYHGDEEIPYRVFISDFAGNAVEEITGQPLSEALEKGLGIINEYEAEDKACGTFVKDSYDLINEFGESYIY